MSGFRCYSVRWSDGTTYASSPLGVQACLKDIADKFLTDTSYHGFSLDTTTNPDGMPVKLVGSYGVYAICFVHTSGSRLMLALNYRGLSPYLNGSSLAPDLGDETVDRGFGNKTTFVAYYAGSYHTMIGGLMACYIPVKSNQDEEQETFDLTKDITNSTFFPPSSSFVVSTSSNGAYYSNTVSKTLKNGHYNANIGQSLIKVGTSENIGAKYNASTGAIASWNKCYSILCDERETIIITSQCTDVSSVSPPVRFAVLGKIQPMQGIHKCFSVQQTFYNHSVSQVGAYYTSSSPSFAIVEPDFNTKITPSTVYLSNANYNYGGTGNDIMVCVTGMIGNNSIYIYPSPFLLQSSSEKTIDDKMYFGLHPICICGGYEKPDGFISDNLRVTTYRSDLAHNTFFNNKEWCVLGYIMMFSGRSDMTSPTSPGFTHGSLQSSYIWHLVFRYDQGNEDSPFGPV